MIILATILIAASGCAGSPKPTPIFLTLTDLDPSYINQRIAMEGKLWSTDTITCQTIVWVEGGKEEERCTGIHLEEAFNLWVNLALLKKGKSGLHIDYGTGGQIFNNFKDLEVYDVKGEDRLDHDLTVRVTGTL